MLTLLATTLPDVLSQALSERVQDLPRSSAAPFSSPVLHEQALPSRHKRRAGLQSEWTVTELRRLLNRTSLRLEPQAQVDVLVRLARSVKFQLGGARKTNSKTPLC